MSIILSTQRSGTHLLNHCLQSHPNISGVGELLLLWKRAGEQSDPIPILEDFFTAGPREVKVCDIMYNHLNGQIIKWLQKREIRIIHLIREDHVRREVSHYLNHHKDKTGLNGIQFAEKRTLIPIRVNPAWVVKYVRRARKAISHYRRVFEHSPYMEITYADMVGRDGLEVSGLPAETSERLLRFLGLELHPLTTTQRKVGTEELRDCMTNYDECMQVVQRELGYRDEATG